MTWINPLEQADWDAESAWQKYGDRSIFHTRAWAKALISTYGFKPAYIVSRESGSFRAALPLMEVNSMLTGNRAVALPFSDICEPLCTDSGEFSELFQGAVEAAQARGWKYLEFHGGNNFFDGATPGLSFYGHRVEIPEDEGAYFCRLKSAVRRAVRKAEGSGLGVEISRDLAAVKQYYRLHCVSRKRHGLPPQPFSFFENIHTHILSERLGIVVLSRWRGDPVSGAIFFHLGDKAIYKFGASDEAFQHLRGNNLIFWEAIRWFSRNGIRSLDLGRTSKTNEGLRKFKVGWNAQERTINYYRFCMDRRQFIPMRDEGYGWHNFIFKTLPLPLSRLTGKILYRHWA